MNPNRMTWLQSVPYLTFEPEQYARKPYPLSWEEQDLLFSCLRADPNRENAADGERSQPEGSTNRNYFAH